MKAEWWHNEDGGYCCSNCGYWHDDLLLGSTPAKCRDCGSGMVENDDMEIDRYYRLSKGVYWVDISKYPGWLLELYTEERERMRASEIQTSS